MPTKFKRNRTSGIGCGYVLMLAVVISVLMIVNSYVVGKVLEANWQQIPELVQDVRLFQFCQIFVPIIMLMIEFYIFDRIRDARHTRAVEIADKTGQANG